MSRGLYISFQWFFIHILRQQNIKLPKRNTLALANTVYIRRNKMYFDCFPLSKYLPMLEKYWYFGFFQSKDVYKVSPYTFTLFLATRNILVEVFLGKNQEKTGFFKNVSKKYIKAIFSVPMDKVIYSKLKQIFKVDKSI